MKRTALLVIAAALAAAGCTADRLTEKNIDRIIDRMSLEEKATMVIGSGKGLLFGGSAEEVNFNPAATSVSGGEVPGATGSNYGFPCYGIPEVILSDGPAGLRISPTREGSDRTYYCTAFPVATALASSWNPPLLEEIGKAIGKEAYEYGVDILLGPGMNLHRNPLNGRNFEYYSEDPFLTGKMAIAMVDGIQSNNVGTSVKHFAANSQETNRKDNDVIISERALREMYLKAFEMVVKESQPWTVMSSYNRINGPYTQEDKWLLTDVLRGEWGFEGLVLTDWTGRRNTAAQIEAGNDLMEPGTPAQIKEIVEKVQSGELSEDALDICVRRVLEMTVRTNSFKGHKPSENPDLKAHAEISRQSALEGMVLLKNMDYTLPMEESQTVDLYGVTSYDFIAGGTGSGNVNEAYTISLKEGLENAGISISERLESIYLKYISAEEERLSGTESGVFIGEPVIPEMAVESRLIKEEAGNGRTAIITIGRNAGEAADRHIENDFNLSETEIALIQDVCDAYHAAGSKVIVVLNICGVIETASWKEAPDAILLAWQLGQEGGNAVADILTGVESPSGKLTMTFPDDYFDLPSAHNFPYDYHGPASFGPVTSVTGRKEPLVKNLDYTLYEEGIYVGYRYFATEGKDVSYPFGYGLSYTEFEYSNPSVKAGKDGFTAQITVTNTGKRAGMESVQLYVAAPEGGLEKPAFELRGFAKTRKLAPGESQTLAISVDAYTLASFNEAAGQWETADGIYEVMFAASSEDVRARAQYMQKKARSWKVN